MKKFSTRDLVLIAMYVALAIVLDYIKEFLPFLNMPNGGSINIALIPIVIGSFHLGWQKGLIIGAMWWLVSSLFGLNEWMINIFQYLLDYVVPSVIIGASSLFYKEKNVLSIDLGIFVMMAIRTLSIIVSGAVFWADGVASGSVAAWIASFTYNLPYCIATAIMLMIIVPIIVLRIKPISK